MAPRGGAVAVRQHSGRSWPRAHRMSGGATACTVPGLGPGQRLVAELVEDVDGLADQLAGLGQGGAFTVDAVGDGGVVVVVGGEVRAWVLPAS